MGKDYRLLLTMTESDIVVLGKTVLRRTDQGIPTYW